jgi:Flp pilus assembly protein CpaB
VLLAAAFVAGNAVLEGAHQTTAVWLAARDLPAGHTLTSSDLRVSDVHLPAGLQTRYVAATSRLDGRVLTRALRQGEMIPADASVSRGAAESSLITVPVAVEHAVGGTLRPGDRVDVIAGFDSGRPTARSVVVARGAQVYRMVDSPGLMTGDGSMIGVTLSVPAEEAARLAFALRNADIDVVRVAPGGAPSMGAVDRSDF